MNMFKLFLFVLSTVYIDAENLDDPDAFIKSLPKHEQVFLLDNIARRINNEVVPNQKPNQTKIVLPNQMLEVHDAFVKKIMREESENILSLRRQGVHLAPTDVEPETPAPKVRKRRADESTPELLAQNITTEVQSTTEAIKTVALKIFHDSSASPATTSPQEATTVAEETSPTASEVDNISSTVRLLASESNNTALQSNESNDTTASANVESVSEAVKTSAPASEVSKISDVLPELPFIASRRSYNPVPISLFNRRAETSKSGVIKSVSNDTTHNIVQSSESSLSSNKESAASSSSASSVASATPFASSAQQYQPPRSPPNNNQITSTQQYAQSPITNVKVGQNTADGIAKATADTQSLDSSSVPLSGNQGPPLLPSFGSPQNNNNRNSQESQSPDQGSQHMPPFSPLFNQEQTYYEPIRNLPFPPENNFNAALPPDNNLNPQIAPSLQPGSQHMPPFSPLFNQGQTYYEPIRNLPYPPENNFNSALPPDNKLNPQIPPSLQQGSLSKYLPQIPENYNEGASIKLIPQYEYSPENAYYRPVNELGQVADGLGSSLRLGIHPVPNEENHHSIPVYNYDPRNAYINPSNRYNLNENDVGNALRFNYYVNEPFALPGKFSFKLPPKFPFRMSPKVNSDNPWVDEEYDFGGFFGGLSRIDESNKPKEVLNEIGYDNPEIQIVDNDDLGDLDLLRNVQFNFPTFSLNAAEMPTMSPVDQDLQSQQETPNQEKRTVLDPYLETLQDMIDSDYDGLRNYDWLRSTVQIQSSLEKLIGVSTVDNVHPYDLSLLKYVRRLYTRASHKRGKKKIIAKTEKGNRLVRPDKQSRFRFPKSRVYKLNKYLDPVAIMNRFRSNLGLKGRREREQENFKMFLIDLRACLDDFHNVIKHVALITNYQNQNWYQNIKDLYLRTRRRKNLLELLLHISAARLFDYLEQSARAYGTELQMSYVLKSEEHQKVLLKTEEELKFVNQIVDELRTNQ